MRACPSRFLNLGSILFSDGDDIHVRVYREVEDIGGAHQFGELHRRVVLDVKREVAGSRQFQIQRDLLSSRRNLEIRDSDGIVLHCQWEC